MRCDDGWQALRLVAEFYHAGALVFGGGHVVLPLLHDVVVATGWVSADAFVTGYGVTQAMPGPIFTFTPISAPPQGQYRTGRRWADRTRWRSFCPGCC